MPMHGGTIDTHVSRRERRGIMERVSILLGHTSIRVTEKHYSPWVRARQEQLEADVMRVLRNDPLALLEAQLQTKVTQ